MAPATTDLLDLTPGDPSGAARFGGKLPYLRDDFSGRLGAVALVYFLLYFIGSALDTLLHPESRVWTGAYWFDVAAMAVALAMFVLTRLRIRPAHLLHSGLAFEVLGAFFFCLSEAFLLVDTGARLHLVSWLCVWVAVFPLFVPAPPAKAIPAVFLAASMGPAAYAVRLAAGGGALPAHVLAAIYIPPYLAAGISLVPIFLVARYSRNLHAAERMGSYELLDLLGRGGMGEVWRARHGMLARPAAIKMIKRDELARGAPDRVRDMVLRFEREARTIARLRSPHTVVLYDYGISPNQTFYYVMELLDGIDLQTLVRKHGPVPPERAALFLRQACGSLAEAHQLGLVHRDIKPANLFACRLGVDCDFVKVLDFGLVRQTETAPDQLTLTRAGTLAGTPAYMAPEALVDGRKVDGRTDIYALGCVAYWLVTGQLVFAGATPLALAVEHLHAEPVPPSRRTELRIPPEFDHIVLACLAKDPGARIQTVQELDRRLAEIHWNTPWTRERAAHWWEAHYPPPATAPFSGPAAAATLPTDPFGETR